VLKAWKCEVYVSTRGASHRKLAATLGATWIGNEKDDHLSRSTVL
jgi:alcohol dehydrogenase, propanol-preferring